ncbi:MULTISPECIES: MFS transporter [unclassified Sphingobacterium]|uniref:MFS transporter n=1 Tax=unclassified Sphingobacterium TaxID=2609468 RepID=UPI002600B824|nr:MULTISPECIES: MFS transporter [unclassified Sphingobacterium]
MKARRAFFISLVSVIIGSMQMAFFLPDGVSCIDGTSSLLDGILFYMPIQFAGVFLLSLLNQKTMDYFLLAAVLFFWIWINKVEFTHRHACWSTYTDAELIKAVLQKSAFTCGVSIALLGVFVNWYNRLSVKTRDRE